MGKLVLRLGAAAALIFTAMALYANFAELPSPMRMVEVEIPGPQLK